MVFGAITIYYSIKKQQKTMIFKKLIKKVDFLFKRHIIVDNVQFSTELLSRKLGGHMTTTTTLTKESKVLLPQEGRTLSQHK